MIPNDINELAEDGEVHRNDLHPIEMREEKL